MSAFTDFLSGKLPQFLKQSEIRSLLDQARNHILSQGRKPSFTVPKAGLVCTNQAQGRELLEAARKEAAPGGVATNLDQINTRAKVLKAAGHPHPYLTAAAEAAGTAGKSIAATAKPFAKPTPTPIKAAAKPAAKPPVRTESTEQYLARRVAEQNAARAAATPPAPVVTGLAKDMQGQSLSILKALASGKFSTTEETRAAVAELSVRGWTRRGSCWAFHKPQPTRAEVRASREAKNAGWNGGRR